MSSSLEPVTRTLPRHKGNAYTDVVCRCGCLHYEDESPQKHRVTKSPELRVPAEGLQVELTAKAASLFYHQGVIEVCCHGGPC